MKRTASARWDGTGKEGSGKLTTESGVLHGTSYSWKSRFADGKGTNPEELIAAALAGCFTMKLAFLISDAGYALEWIETSANIDMEDGSFRGAHLVVSAWVPGMPLEAFQRCTEEARANCPVSKALNMPVTMEGKLDS